MWAHVHDEPPPVTSRRPDLPAEIDYIVAKAMAKQPENRYATCRKLAIALHAVGSDPAASEGSGKVFPAAPPAEIRDSPPPSPVPAGMTSTYTPPTPARVRAPATASPPRWRWWWLAAGGVFALALIGGSAAGILNYLNSRFPNTAEQALLDQVPLAVRDSCTRNTDAEQTTANVQASVTCTSDDEVNTVVFTKFSSPNALDNHYRDAVATAEIDQSSGDCRSAERAEGMYMSEIGDTSGRALCYQQRGSSFIKWIDEESQTLGVAMRTDPEYAELRGWWAGVVGVKLPTPEPAQAPSPPPPPPAAAPAVPPEPAPVPPAPRPVPPAPEPEAAQAEENRGRGEEDRGQGEEDEEPGEEDTPKPPSAPPITLDGPVPAAPGPQQGGPPVPGTGGCTAITDNRREALTGKFYACTVTQAAPVYLPETTEPQDDLRPKRYPFLCQEEGAKYSIENRTNDWWAWVGLGNVGVWAPTMFLADGPDDAPVPGLPVCGSAPTTTEAPPTTTTDPTTTSETPTTTPSPTQTATQYR